MLYFESDYTEGAHPRVLEALVKTNLEHLSGYGCDRYTESAKEKIKKELNATNADIEFITGGTQTNRVVISSILEPYEGVIAADSGHVAVHEAGAIESSGHKVLTIPHFNGKLAADDVRAFIRDFYNDGNYEHMVFPGAVYISHPTEYGTLYTKAELEALYSVCREYDIPLYLDGARLAYALASGENDLSLADIYSLTDVFYIGGTKCGALCGEAVVFKKSPRHFSTRIKQQGALLAKGRLLGVQFDALFTDSLYYEVGKNAARTASRLVEILKEKNYRFFIDSPTNQQFVVVENSFAKELSERVKYCFIEKFDDSHSVIRFVTSWATDIRDVEMLKEVL